MPSLPDLPARAEDQPTAIFVKGRRILIPEMGDRADEIAARFFAMLADRGVKGLRLSLGKLVIPVADGKSDSRDYFFAELDLGNGALTTMAVRIAPFGRDLFVEWRHYVTPGMTTYHSDTAGWVAGVAVYIMVLMDAFGSGASGAILAPFFGLLPAGLAGLIATAIIRVPGRKGALEGFQAQTSTTFQLSVSAALEKAIDLAGISKELFQELRDDDEKNRRVI